MFLYMSQSNESIDKPFPFKQDIPRYPGEPPLEGPPQTAADSVFNDPIAIRILDLTRKAHDPHNNSRVREGIFKDARAFLDLPERQKQALLYLKDLIASSANEERRKNYTRFLENTIGDETFIHDTVEYPDPNSPDFSDLLRQKLELPEQSGLVIPKRVFDLVNDSIQLAYPMGADKNIAPLKPQDVIVVRNNALNNFLQQLRTIEQNQAGYLLLPRDTANWGNIGNISLMTFPTYPGRPVIISDEYLRSQSGLPLSIFEYLVAKELIHEQIHRIAKRKIARDGVQKGLLELALSANIGPISEKESEQQMEERIDNFYKFIEKHNPQVQIDGGILLSYCEDEDGYQKQLWGLGYDMNESIVEQLSLKPRRHLFDAMRKDASVDNPEEIINILKENQGQGSVANGQIAYSDLRSHLQKMGLGSVEKLFTAYLNGDIPYLWRKHFPQSAYPH